MSGGPDEPSPRYWKQQTSADPIEVRPIHDGDGAIGIRRLFRGLTTTGLNLHVWELGPGVSEGRHTHPAADPDDDWEEVYYVLSGRGVLELEDEHVPLEPGDAVLIPVDVDHGLRTVGEEPLRIVLVFAHPLPAPVTHRAERRPATPGQHARMRRMR